MYRYEKYKASGIDWIGEIPSHWELKKLKYVSKKVQTGSTPPSNREDYSDGETTWFTPSDFSDKLLLKESRRKISANAISDNVVKIFPANSVLPLKIAIRAPRTALIVSKPT